MKHSDSRNFKVIGGIAGILLIFLLSQGFMVKSLREMYAADDWVMDFHATALIQAEQLRSLAELKFSNSRGVLHGEQPSLLPKIADERAQFLGILEKMRKQATSEHVSSSSNRIRLFEEIKNSENEHQMALEHALQIRIKGRRTLFEKSVVEHVLPAREKTVDLIDQLIRLESRHFTEARSESSKVEAKINCAIDWVICTSLVLLSLIAIFILRLMKQGNQLLTETKRAVEARDTMLSVVSHDLRNPLTAIRLNAQLLRRKGYVTKYVEAILQLSDRMYTLIQDLLDLTKIESGNLVLELREYSTSELVSEVDGMFQPIVAEKLIDFEIQNRAREGAVECDYNRLFQVISNLLGNAIKFTPAGGKITLSIEEEESEIRFTVQDSGSGISVEQIPHLCDRFWQADRSGRDGTGLGLSIVKGIIQAHKGKLFIRSSQGNGSAFAFTLPKSEKSKISLYKSINPFNQPNQNQENL